MYLFFSAPRLHQFSRMLSRDSSILIFFRFGNVPDDERNVKLSLTIDTSRMDPVAFTTFRSVVRIVMISESDSKHS